MPVHPCAKKASVKAEVTTTSRPLTAVAAEAGVSIRTIWRWKAEEGWTRPAPERRPAARKPPLEPHAVAAARRAYEKGLAVIDIAILTDRCDASIVRIARRNGWARLPPQALPAAKPVPRPRRSPLTPRRLAAAGAAYGKGVHAADLAALIGRSAARVNQLAREHGWARAPAPDERAPAGEPFPRPELAGIEAALRGGGLVRAELLDLVGRAAALAAADALAGDPRAEARAAALARHAATIRSLPEGARGAPAAEETHDHGYSAPGTPFTFAETERLIENIARRFEAFSRARRAEDLPGGPAAARA